MTQIQNTVRIHPALLNFVRPSDHSTFSPSASDRWWFDACPFSVNYCANIPNLSSKYAEEGTLAHSVAEAAVRQRLFDIGIPVDLQMAMLNLDDKGVEMMDCANQYADVVVEYWLQNKEALGDIIWWGLERGVPIFPEEGAFGTADCIIVGTKGCAIIDFKYGKGKAVSAESRQLKVYAAGIRRYLEFFDETYANDYTFYSVVHQPRIQFGTKETSYTYAEMTETLNEIWQSIQASKTATQPCEGNHCFWCPAKRTPNPDLKCPIIKEKPLLAAKQNFGKFIADMAKPVESYHVPNTARDEALIKIITLIPMLKQIAKDGMEEFDMRLKAGEVIPGVRIVDEYGRREIAGTNIEEKVATIRAKFPHIVATEVVPATVKLKTLTQLQKEIGKEGLDQLCQKSVTKQVEILDERQRSILGDLDRYVKMLNNGNGQEEL